MAIGVRPTFFEEGYFNSPTIKEKRLIENKNIYSISCVHTNGDGYINTFFTRTEGKLKKQKTIEGRNTDVPVPIMPGTYNFFVSKHGLAGIRLDRLDNRLPLLNQNNSVEVKVTDGLNQEIVLPWPMCYHSSDGAIAVADYILGEIRNNSVSRITRTIHNFNDFVGRLEQFRQLPFLIRAFSEHPRHMTIEARMMWVSKVRQDGPWDHKPLIAGDESLRENAVWRPLRRNGSFVRGYFHKYKEHDYFYDIWSNIHYGYVGRAAGFTADELLDGAGLEQRVTDIFRNRSLRGQVHDTNVQGMRRFDDIPDQRTIELGIEFFASTEGNAMRLTRENILDGLERLGNEGLLGEQRVKHICFDDGEFTEA